MYKLLTSLILILLFATIPVIMLNGEANSTLYTELEATATSLKLIAPSISETKGAVRGVPIRFNVKSKELELTYTLIDPPRGMRIEKRMLQKGRCWNPEPMNIDGVDVLWDVPMDMEEKTYTIRVKVKNTIGEESEINFPIKVPKTTPIQTKIVNNELIVIDKNSLLYGMKMKGYNGEDISNLKLRSVDYEDVWKHNGIAFDKRHIVYILDNMPEELSVKMPEFIDTYQKRIVIGMSSYKYNEFTFRGTTTWKAASQKAYLYDGTNGYIYLHKSRVFEGNGSKVFMIMLSSFSKIGE